MDDQPSSVSGCVIRAATEAEKNRLLCRHAGFVAVRGSVIFGYVGYTKKAKWLYCHSLHCQGDVMVCAQLIQAVRQKARELGRVNLRFCVTTEYPTLARLVGSGRAKILQVELEMPVK